MELNTTHLQIESFTSRDLEVVAGLQPDGWPDIFPTIEYYCASDFCFPLKATLEGKVVGIGTAIIHGRTAWLGHIIVSQYHRNAGIGSAITKGLIDLCYKNSCRTISLVATALGEPVYKKFGFEVQTTYLFFDHEKFLSLHSPADVCTFHKQHEPSLLQLDRSVSGEDRKKLLNDHLEHTLVLLEDSVLKGFYMPTLGDGLIIADSPAAGLLLMKLRGSSTKKFCIPIINENAVNFLRQEGFTEYRRASRMILGERLSWDGSKIYSRIGGNLG